MTVLGGVLNSDTETGQTFPNYLISFSHTHDADQLLDADELGTDDLRLEKPTLDSSHQLQT